MLKLLRGKLLLLMLVAATMLAAPHQARATIDLTFSNVVGATLHFNNGTFSFQPSSINKVDFAITQVDNSPTGVPLLGDSAGSLGVINGLWDIGSITTSGNTQSANVTLDAKSPNPATVTITDTSSSHNTLTGNVAFLNIYTTTDPSGTTGTVNGGGTINLTNLSYSGSSKDLAALASANSGTISLAFRFNNVTAPLTTLVSGTTDIGYTGQITAAPAPPGVWLLGIGMAVLGTGRFLRRRTSFLQAA